MHIAPFSVSRLPRIEFGPGVVGKLPTLARRFGTRALLVTGAQSFCATPHWPDLIAALSAQGITWQQLQVNGEPSPKLIDDAVRAYRDTHLDVVIGIGGGSALDAAKAIAGLLQPGNSVMGHLEGVGPELAYHGPATPFIAVPTTAGTGSEATKNAVLSVQGSDGFKKSFRDEKLVAEYAVVDPDLLASCPPALVAAATRINILAMQARDPHNPALEKYALVGRLLSRQQSLSQTEAHAALIDTLENWTNALMLPRLAHYGVHENDIARIVAQSGGSSMKTNPVMLDDSEIAQVITARL